MTRRMRRVGGTPIEEAPVWALAILAVVLWLVAFPALVGLLNGFEVVDGGGWTIAVAAAVLSLFLVAGLARQKPWRRAHLAEPATEPAAEPAAEPPPFVRFSTWCITTVLVPNVLHGTLILFRGGEGFDYASAWLIGLMVSAIHGGFALADLDRKLDAVLDAQAGETVCLVQRDEVLAEFREVRTGAARLLEGIYLAAGLRHLVPGIRHPRAAPAKASRPTAELETTPPHRFPATFETLGIRAEASGERSGPLGTRPGGSGDGALHETMAPHRFGRRSERLGRRPGAFLTGSDRLRCRAGDFLAGSGPLGTRPGGFLRGSGRLGIRAGGLGKGPGRGGGRVGGLGSRPRPPVGGGGA